MNTPSSRLLAATGVSVAAHAVLFAGSWLMPPEPVPELPLPLSARLEPLPAPPPAVTAPAPKPRAAPPRRSPPAPRQVAVAPRPVPQPEVLTVPATPDVETVPEPAAPTVVTEPVVVASAAPTEFRMPEAPPLPSFPRKGRITYTLILGDSTPVGRTVQTWEFDGTEYKLGSQSESTGLIEMFRPHRFHYLSQGTVSDQGLRPERFLASVKRGSRSEESIAIFNWEEGQVRLGRAPQQSTVALPAGSQDIISFMYNLALAPPAPGRMRLPFTRGKRLDWTSFDVLPEENIETPLGRLRAVPVMQVREAGEESLAIWLATEYRNLPIRIRFFGRDGEVTGEQMVNEIQVSDQ